jgi:hypothetical protein
MRGRRRLDNIFPELDTSCPELDTGFVKSDLVMLSFRSMK